jgi:hypothetical protein
VVLTPYDFYSCNSVAFAFFILAATFNGSQNMKNMQILKYAVNKSDYNNHEPQSSSGCDRLVAILLYLSGVKPGGQTVFPSFEVILFSHNANLKYILLSVIHIYIPFVIYFFL